ncbi:MAG: hypothetical protein WBP42_00605 [Candidatus Zixiibacteriota bacterium]
MVTQNELQQLSFGELKKRRPILTGSPADLVLRKPLVKVVEMEDVLFHLDSCVVMPSAPKGASSQDAADDPDMTQEEKDRSELQDQLSGLQTIAVTYIVLEEHNTLGVLITGHTDTSGGLEFNFILSELRCNNVLFLLEQRREEWADLSHKRHRIEDYQQIMAHYAKKRPEFNCDPGEINNSYTAKTHEATVNFFKANGLDNTQAAKVKSDGQHKWPIVAWIAVFDLYDKEIDEILNKGLSGGNGPKGPEKRNTCSSPQPDKTKVVNRRDRLRFADIERKTLPCGESFPIQASQKDNFKSQMNRRVEILFFNGADLPPLNITTGNSKKLTADTVPIFATTFFDKIYVDAFELFAINYHLKFVFHNRVAAALTPVPEGLTISAFDETGKKLEARTSFSSGTYVVKVRDDDKRKKIHFEFETSDEWIKMDKSGGTIIFMTRTEINNLPFKERLQFYDLPEKWSSKNYWTRFDGSMDSGDRFETVMKDRKQIKPFGQKLTDSQFPLTFSLDDIVLVDGNGGQSVGDRNAANSDIALTKDSRYALFHVVDGNLLLFDPDPALLHHTQTPLTENLIIKTPQEPRLLIFATGESSSGGAGTLSGKVSTGFFDVWDKRTKLPSGVNQGAKDVIGARAAVLNDREVRFSEIIREPNKKGDAKSLPYAALRTGNFEVHYIHRGTMRGDLERHFLLIYWSARFKAHFDSKPTLSDKKAVTNDEIRKFALEGFRNSKVHWERKEYSIDPVDANNAPAMDVLPVFYFEPKLSNRGGQHKCMVSISNNPDVAFMGITESQMHRTDFATRADSGGQEIDPLDLVNARNLVAGHELGHATGKPDEYIERREDFKAPADAFRQPLPGAPLGGDRRVLMNDSMALPRMRYWWNFVNWLNDASKDAGKLKPILKDRQFRIRYFFKFVDGATSKVKEISYHVIDEHRDIYNPFKAKEPFALATGAVDLNLYKLGPDETAHLIRIKGNRTPSPFDGALSVYFKLGFEFVNHPTNPAKKWTKALREAWTGDLESELAQLNANAFMFLPDAKIRPGDPGKTDKAFQRTLFSFIAVSRIGVPSSVTHYDIRVVFRDDAKITKRSGKSLEVGNDTSKTWVANYVCGKDDGATDAPISLMPASKRVKVTDLAFLRNFIRQELGNNDFDFKESF